MCTFQITNIKKELNMKRIILMVFVVFIFIISINIANAQHDYKIDHYNVHHRLNEDGSAFYRFYFIL